MVSHGIAPWRDLARQLTCALIDHGSPADLRLSLQVCSSRKLVGRLGQCGKVGCLLPPIPIKLQPREKKASCIRSAFRASADSGDRDNGDLYSVNGSSQLRTCGFCIIEGPETIRDFAQLQLREIQDNIKSRRNAIFLLMEEVRRLRIQQRIKCSEQGLRVEDESEVPEFSSFIPFLPPLTSATLKLYYATCFLLMCGIVIFGGILAPMLELKLGISGFSYKDFISGAHLPIQLSQVDPIVASFSGGAVGVISSLMVVEMNNVKQQEQKRCKYCHGTGYLACARCVGTGALATQTSNLKTSLPDRCSNCSGTGKVMCPTCLCTGMAMANEHNLRIDPFDP
eukprot:c19198_g1_i1 orf=574-1593(-)